MSVRENEEYRAEHHADPADAASTIEQLERQAGIAKVRRSITITPILDCVDCSDMTQSHAKGHCRDYPTCVADWELEQKAAQRNGLY